MLRNSYELSEHLFLSLSVLVLFVNIRAFDQLTFELQSTSKQTNRQRDNPTDRQTDSCVTIFMSVCKCGCVCMCGFSIEKGSVQLLAYSKQIANNYILFFFCLYGLFSYTLRYNKVQCTTAFVLWYYFFLLNTQFNFFRHCFSLNDFKNKQKQCDHKRS